MLGPVVGDGEEADVEVVDAPASVAEGYGVLAELDRGRLEPEPGQAGLLERLTLGGTGQRVVSGSQ